MSDMIGLSPCSAGPQDTEAAARSCELHKTIFNRTGSST